MEVEAFLRYLLLSTLLKREGERRERREGERGEKGERREERKIGRKRQKGMRKKEFRWCNRGKKWNKQSQKEKKKKHVYQGGLTPEPKAHLLNRGTFLPQNR